MASGSSMFAGKLAYKQAVM